MLYYCCITCGTLFADKAIIWETKLEEICNSKVSESEKDTQKKDLLESLHVENSCCRMRFLTYIKKVDIIK